MKNLYTTYFAGVRWVELALAFGAAVLGDLQLTVHAGGKVDQQATLKAVGVGAGIAWAYLRMPKDPGKEPTSEAPEGSSSLPPGVDNTGPAHDVSADVLTDAATAILTPVVGPAAPILAENVVKEIGRVTHRGIKWDGRIRL